MSHNYAALIVDLKGSKGYSAEDRTFIQSFLKDLLDWLNILYHNVIVKDVDFSAGDEVQGLFLSSEAAYLYYRALSLWLYPVAIRAGIGVGTWDVRLKDKGTTGQDGSAYHRARYALERTARVDRYPVLLCSGTRCDLSINSIIASAANIVSGQSAHQNQAMLLSDLAFPLYNTCFFGSGRAPHCDANELLKKKTELVNKLTCGAYPIDDIVSDSFSVTGVREVCSTKPFDEIELCMTCGKKRGIPKKLSELLGVSRQAADRLVNAGNVYSARNGSLAALTAMSAIPLWE